MSNIVTLSTVFHHSNLHSLSSVIHSVKNSSAMLAEVLREIDELPLDPVLFVAPLQYLLVSHAKNRATVANPQGLCKRSLLGFGLRLHKNLDFD